MSHDFRKIARATKQLVHTFVGEQLDRLKEEHLLLHQEAAGALGPVMLAHAVRLAYEAGVPASAFRAQVEEMLSVCGFPKEGKA